MRVERLILLLLQAAIAEAEVGRLRRRLDLLYFVGGVDFEDPLASRRREGGCGDDEDG